MKFLSIVALLGVVFAFPEPGVRWLDAEHRKMRVEVPVREDFIKRCLQGGLEVRFRYEVRLCKRRVLWLDNCEEPRVEVHSVQFDPIQESYRAALDMLGDKLSPAVTHFADQGEALGTLNSIPTLSLPDLGYSEKEFPQDRDPYLNLRVIADCKGDYNETIAKISSLMTLGLLDVGTFDSGWVAFRIG